MRASQTVLPVTAHSLSFSDSARAVADEELQLTERALRRNPKSYGAWHHRRWSVRRLGTRADTGHELALCAQLLAARQLPQKGLVLDFYVLLSDTVRRYVEGRFGIRAPEQTTKEFLQAARHHPAIREDHQRMLAAFLRSLGHRPTWVFGVRTWPFQAHCWLQVEDIALDDEAERLCAFAPILGV